MVLNMGINVDVECHGIGLIIQNIPGFSQIFKKRIISHPFLFVLFIFRKSYNILLTKIGTNNFFIKKMLSKNFKNFKELRTRFQGIYYWPQKYVILLKNLDSEVCMRGDKSLCNVKFFSLIFCQV
jgi:hypothetical protein